MQLVINPNQRELFGSSMQHTLMVTNKHLRGPDLVFLIINEALDWQYEISTSRCQVQQVFAVPEFAMDEWCNQHVPQGKWEENTSLSQQITCYFKIH